MLVIKCGVMRVASIRIFLCIFVGVLVGAAWMIFADGYMYNGRHAHRPTTPVFEWSYAMPCLAMTMVMLMLNVTSPRQMHGGSSSMGDGDELRMAICARIWVFVMIALGFVCIGCAVWIASTVFSARVTPYTWTGGAIVINTCLIMFAGLVYFMRPR